MKLSLNTVAVERKLLHERGCAEERGLRESSWLSHAFNPRSSDDKSDNNSRITNNLYSLNMETKSRIHLLSLPPFNTASHPFIMKWVKWKWLLLLCTAWIILELAWCTWIRTLWMWVKRAHQLVPLVRMKHWMRANWELLDACTMAGNDRLGRNPEQRKMRSLHRIKKWWCEAKFP